MKRMIKKEGFSFVEMIIIVCIITVLSALSLVGIVRSRITASEESAMEGLRTVQAVFESYRMINPGYPASFDELSVGNPPYLDAKWIGDSSSESGEIHGYVYNILEAGPDYYTVAAYPTAFKLAFGGSARKFYISQDGEIVEDIDLLTGRGGYATGGGGGGGEGGGEYGSGRTNPEPGGWSQYVPGACPEGGCSGEGGGEGN
jgi:type II secretory pathway pseudopilin PulG